MLRARAPENSKPVAARPHFPAAYGAPTDTALMPWATANERLMHASHYWLCTVGPDAMPMARPLDGVWIANALYFGGDPATRWRRNLRANAHASVHLDDAASPVMLEGEVVVDGASDKLAAVIAEKTHAKYGWGSVDQYRAEVCAFIPHRAIAWTGLFENATRFTFP
ncbi:MAG: pyridoxamine 5'-phosphate oxidase family protein [Gammaproteobacteria bacterium]|nr:pyridoxamine 5'-phosphate oxidase family protein [Gammaproteobacteria bacterium]